MNRVVDTAVLVASCARVAACVGQFHQSEVQAIVFSDRDGFIFVQGSAILPPVHLVIRGTLYDAGQLDGTVFWYVVVHLAADDERPQVC